MHYNYRTFMKRFVCYLLLALALCSYAEADIRFSSTRWDFGVIPDTAPVKKDFTAQNDSDQSVSITIIPTCDCLYAEPARFKLKPGEEIIFTLTFDPEEYGGEIKMRYIINTDSADMKKAIFLVTGEVETRDAPKTVDDGGTLSAEGGQVPGESGGVSEPKKTIEAHYYYTTGCKECAKFLAKAVPEAEKRFDIAIEMHEKDIMEPEVFDELTSKLEDLRIELTEMPVLIIKGKVLQGEKEINQKFQDLLFVAASGALDGQCPCVRKPVPPADSEPIEKRIGVISVLAAGLLDGINPCAFTTLLFLLSALAVAGKQQREIFLIGIFYTIAVFTSYFTIGIGLFTGLRKAYSFPVIATVIQWVLVGVLFVFAGLSIYDYTLIKQGRHRDVKLQLPASFKKRIHSSIRTGSKSAALILSALVLGFSVSLFELACTGQIYFPTIAYMVQIRKSATSYLLLGVYNIGFIIPLIAVFALAYAGISSEKLTKVFREHVGKVKLVTAVFFVFLAGIMIYMIL